MREALFERAYPFALRSARVRSAAAVASGAVLPADHEDWEQETFVRVWQALCKYDSGRAGLRTFVEVVVGTQSASMLRSCRRRPALKSIEDQHLIADGEFRQIDLRADVQRVLACVSRLDRAVAQCLMVCSVSETHSRMGISRGTVYRAIGRLRVAFTKAGLTSSRDCRRREVC